MSSQNPIEFLTVEHLKACTNERDIAGYALHQKFLVRAFALGESNQNIKTFLQRKGFYSPDVNPIQKINILKNRENKQAFLSLLTASELTYLISPKTNLKLSAIARAFPDNLVQGHFEQFPYLSTLKQDYDKPEANKAQVKEYLNNARCRFDLLLYSKILEIEVNQGMTIDLFMTGARISEDRNEAWKLHINMDMSKDSKNNQEKVDIAYKILLETAKQCNIKSLKLLAPFANINDMQDREISIYLKSQDPKEDIDNIATFISTVEKKFKENGIRANGTKIRT